MRYYPLNRVKTNQKATSDDITLNGQVYTGYYYETFDGELFTGKNPIQGPSQRLVKLEIPGGNTDKPLRIVDGNDDYNNITSLNTQQIKDFQTPQPYYPQPTDDDYARKSFERYFVKKRGQAGFVIEVDKATYDSLKDADSVYDYVNYEAISTLWQLVGPLRDDRTNKQYKVAGIVDTNERLINAKEPGFPGLKAFIGGEYAKFAKPTK
jgi:hypothetical protein